MALQLVSQLSRCPLCESWFGNGVGHACSCKKPDAAPTLKTGDPKKNKPGLLHAAELAGARALHEKELASKSRFDQKFVDGILHEIRAAAFEEFAVRLSDEARLSGKP